MTDKEENARDYANARGSLAMIYPIRVSRVVPPLDLMKTLFAGLFGARRWPSVN